MQNHSPTRLLETLQNQPSYDIFCNALKNLKSHNNEQFCLKSPSALTAKINDQLIRINVPDFWNILYSPKDKGPELALLLECLKNITALGSIFSHLKFLVNILEGTGESRNNSNHEQKIVILLELLSLLLTGDDFANYIWWSFEKSEEDLVKRQMMWAEFVNLIASGKLLSITSQAATLVQNSDAKPSWNWIATGSDFARWLGLNSIYMARSKDANEQNKQKAIALFFGRSVMLGYSDETIKPVLEFTFLRPGIATLNLAPLVKNLRAPEQKNFMKSFLRFITDEGIDENGNSQSSVSQETSERHTALSFLAAHFLADNASLKKELVTCLTSSTGTIAENSVFTLRVMISALSSDMERMQEIFEKSLKTFGDKLYIKHAPIMHQQAVAQVLLLATGYVHRVNPMFVFTLVRSSILTHGISNRLSAASGEARFLGMVASMAISGLVDKPENRISFDFDSYKAEEANCYINLVHINDPIGTSDDLNSLRSSSASKMSPSNTKIQKQLQPDLTPKPPLREIKSPGGIIEEMEEDDDKGAEDFVRYAIADSDPEDEEEDPTLVRRDRPKPPVYIRDLIAGLNDYENYDRYTLALENAAGLIMRKSNFGKEVTDHIYDLASVIVGLRDHYELESFDELRLSATIALLIASPERMGPWFCREYFNGDYSLSQRVAILSTIGLGVRQVAGFDKVGNDKEGATPTKDRNSFRSLPEKLHKLYISDSSPIEATAKELERAIVQPVALSAADKLSGPDALKVRTFSSRMEVEKRRKKPIANQLAQIVNGSFFFPLVGLWEAQVRSHGPTNIYLSTTLLPHFVKTLALLLHASGPSTLSLPQMTTEFWSLLLSLRTRALEDIPSLEAVLFAILVLLEINLESGGKQRLVQENPRELQETQEWTELVFGKFDERIGGEEGSRVKTLAASVLIKLKEVVDWYQGVLFG